MGTFVAEHLEEQVDRRRRQFRGQPDYAALNMDPSQ